jgi:hypothetical protein
MLQLMKSQQPKTIMVLLWLRSFFQTPFHWVQELALAPSEVRLLARLQNLLRKEWM